MAYSAEVKNQVKERLKKGEKVKDIANDFGISLPTIYKWKKEVGIEKSISLNQNNEITKKEEIRVSYEIKKLIAKRKDVEAINLADKYPYNHVIQSQKIGILIAQKKYDEAKKIGGNELFKNVPEIQSQMIKIEIIEGNIERAKEIGYRKEFENDEVIQSQLIGIALKEGNLEEAEEIGYRIKFRNVEAIQSQMMMMAVMENDIEEAKRIGKKIKLRDSAEIQSKVIDVLLKDGEIEKAKRIGSREIFENCEKIQIQMKYIDENEAKIREERKRKQEERRKKERQKFLNIIRTKLYYNKITSEDIQEIQSETSILEKDKLYLLLAICEKQGLSKRAKELIKKYENENQDVEKDKNLNLILQRIESKKAKIFDYSYYYGLLQWEEDEELKKEYEEEIEKEKEEKREKIINKSKKEQVVKPEVKVEKFVHPVVVGQVKKKDFKASVKVVSKDINQEIKPQRIKELNHFDEIMEYLTKKRYDIYSKAQSPNYEIQREAIAQWDKMENLLEKVKASRDNKEYMNQLYEKISTLKIKEQGIDR